MDFQNSTYYTQVERDPDCPVFLSAPNCGTYTSADIPFKDESILALEKHNLLRKHVKGKKYDWRNLKRAGVVL